MTAGDFNGAVAAAVACTFLWHVWQGYRAPRPPVGAPKRPVAPSDDAEWLLLPFQLVGGLAALCWCLLGLCVFLAPLALLVLWVAR